ncbi:MAG: hypothetical protein TR69_WS6001000646 [candidate division WS6 bacterium OLB20]|uniref:Uncharacterized protein n=1 Tax=candidate division WS6 bacterium OLB20 TaxID=1617426 RepID=A0A136LYB1_9BACT|nr:MAG: hypothetical protein TR69_WS6001000646 [candidate division WS6 bacterium OLB20]
MQQQNLPAGGNQNPTFLGNQHSAQAPKKMKGMLSSNIVPPMLVVITVLLVINIFLTISPPYIQQRNLTQQVMEEVAEQVEVNPFETPVVSVVADAENLRSSNSIQAQVYANAQDGDYVLGYSDKMVIYRRSTGEIVYEGDSPGTILNRNQQALRDSVVKAAVSSGVIGSAENANPQLSVVTDPKQLQSQDAEFYKNAQSGDVIAIFPNNEVILLVRSANGQVTIIEQGEYNTSIVKN